MCRLRNMHMCDYQESVTTGQTHRHIQTDRHRKKIPMCRYASHAAQKLSLFGYEIYVLIHNKAIFKTPAGSYIKVSLKNECQLGQNIVLCQILYNNYHDPKFLHNRNFIWVQVKRIFKHKTAFLRDIG